MQQRSFLRYFMGLALPVILQQLLAHLLAMSDTIMLGAFSEDAISAVSVANKYFFIYNLVIFGLSNGVGLFISQYHGALQKEIAFWLASVRIYSHYFYGYFTCISFLHHVDVCEK